ncbi:2-amino-3,7-dideoxy-D-threo-hept-6-ulosonate synthase [Micromonospora halophytica]|uniref:2-amino-3,7-dideoxy-D-threo-hept-6-ulosonate synthase n=2 Tax=Micromonospora halophytica TaxID=47864 RepID=A0A1C5IMC1_9ACTN|nr:2-amino-3,7-dideoxy-D-threo-hept-6-ulosonate synthase [Micromonospora halophytica]
MEATGRDRRLRRLWGSVSGRTVLMPIDQPVTMGPIAGLDAIDAQLTRLLAGAPNAIIGHRGVLRRVPAEAARSTSVVMHLSAGTALSGRGHVKKLTGDVVEAVQLGADAVSVQVTFGVPEETDMLHDLAQVAAGCSRWGMPLLAMVYVAGIDPAEAPEKIAHGARAAAELGSDIVKVPYTGSADSFATVVAGCFAPVVMAGGEPSDSWEDVLLDVKDALSAGAAGVCIGRKVQQHSAPDEALADLHALVHANNLG